MNHSVCVTTDDSGRTYVVFFLIEHERGDSPTGVGAITGLTANMDSGTAPAILILCTGDSVSRHWHDGEVMERRI